MNFKPRGTNFLFEKTKCQQSSLIFEKNDFLTKSFNFKPTTIIFQQNSRIKIKLSTKHLHLESNNCICKQIFKLWNKGGEFSTKYLKFNPNDKMFEQEIISFDHKQFHFLTKSCIFKPNRRILLKDIWISNQEWWIFYPGFFYKKDEFKAKRDGFSIRRDKLWTK